MGVELRNVNKEYDGTLIIKNANLKIKNGEFVVFVGPSGCGKSTLMRSIAGLEEITSGDILINDEIITDAPPAKRGVAMVFQSYALYPHMSVYDNMAFSLKLAKVDKVEIANKIKKTAESLQMTELLDRLPKNLSGGQRQRVAIGRAIIREPKVFLFDEPLSNLDANLRANTRIEIAKLHNLLKTTMLYVTHDQVEAMTLADKIVVLNKGIIMQVGSPDDLYLRPDNMFVAGFIGSPKMNFIEISKNIEAKNILKKLDSRQNIRHLGIRSEHLFLVKEEESLLSGIVDLAENLGEYILYYVRLEDGNIITVKSNDTDHKKINDNVFMSFNNENLHLFDVSQKAIR